MRFATYLWIIMIWIGLRPAAASAQTFEDGYQSYVRNQFPVAELQFKGALKKAKTDEDKAFIQKFIGICQYMRGDKKGANISFIQSVRLDSNVQIDEEEVLDPSVVPFFNSIKGKVNAEEKKRDKEKEKEREREKVASSPPPPRPVQPRPSPKKSQKSASKSSKSRKTNVSDSAMSLPDDTLVAEKSERSSFNYLHLLPFGAGQFANGSPILGSTFAAAEIAALYVFFDANNTIAERENLNTVVANKEGLNDQQREDFYKANNAFIATVKNQKNLALLSFFALWAAGSTESILHAPKKSNVTLLPDTHNGESAWVVEWKSKF